MSPTFVSWLRSHEAERWLANSGWMAEKNCPMIMRCKLQHKNMLTQGCAFVFSVYIRLKGAIQGRLLCLLLSHIQLFATPWPCGSPSSSIHGSLQARILEWVANSFCSASSPPSDWTWVSCIASRLFTIWVIRKAPKTALGFACLNE